MVATSANSASIAKVAAVNVTESSSRLLPSGYMAITGATTRVMKPFTYLFDEDGYVSEISWMADLNSMCYIRYEYR